MQFPAGLVRKNGDAEGIKTGDDRGTRGVCFQSVHDKASLQYVIRLLSIQQSPLFSLSLIGLIGLHTHTHSLCSSRDDEIAEGLRDVQTDNHNFHYYTKTNGLFILGRFSKVFSHLIG